MPKQPKLPRGGEEATPVQGCSGDSQCGQGSKFAPFHPDRRRQYGVIASNPTSESQDGMESSRLSHAKRTPAGPSCCCCTAGFHHSVQHIRRIDRGCFRSAVSYFCILACPRGRTRVLAGFHYDVKHASYLHWRLHEFVGWAHSPVASHPPPPQQRQTHRPRPVSAQESSPSSFGMIKSNKQKRKPMNEDAGSYNGRESWTSPIWMEVQSAGGPSTTSWLRRTIASANREPKKNWRQSLTSTRSPRPEARSTTCFLHFERRRVRQPCFSSPCARRCAVLRRVQ